MKKVNILQLRPTQFAVGMLEVDEKIESTRKFSKKERRKFIKDNPVPVVRSYDKELYVVDKHHFLLVCYHLGVRKVFVEVIKDLSKSKKKMNYVSFWKWMFKSRNSYPFCQFGEGPREAIYLPRDVRGLADDPYRSIAWFVRKAGAFENSDKNFAEFQWANYFRKKNLLGKQGRVALPEVLKKAVVLSQSKSARHLPGYKELKAAAKKSVKEKAEKKGKVLEKKL